MKTLKCSCGGDARLIYITVGYSIVKCYVECTKCGKKGNPNISRIKAIKEWENENKRNNG